MMRTTAMLVMMACFTAMAAAEPTTMPATTQPAAGLTTQSAPPAPLTAVTRSDRSGRGRHRRSSSYSYSASTQPAFISTPGGRPMSGDFAVLSRRSMFAKGHVIFDGGESSARSADEPPPLESALIFNGVTVADDQTVAFIENTGSGKVTLVRVGDAIARGKIAAISLNALSYESGGAVTHVNIGQTLAGTDSPVAGGGTAAAVEGSGPTTQAAPAGQTTDSSADAVLERLRQRRRQELGGPPQ